MKLAALPICQDHQSFVLQLFAAFCSFFSVNINNSPISVLPASQVQKKER